MALKDLNTKINDYRDKSAATRAELSLRIEETRNNPNLSAAGKAEVIAKSYREAHALMTTLAGLEEDALATKRLELERSLFGQFASDPASIIAYRDAQERVGQLGDNEQHIAKQMLHTAQISGDNTLAAALLGKALNVGWSSIVTDYSTQHPDKAAQLRDLSDVIHFQEDHDIDFQRTADYSFTKPNEIAHYTDNTIARIADSNDGEHDAPESLGLRDLEQWAGANG